MFIEKEYNTKIFDDDWSSQKKQMINDYIAAYLIK